MFEALGNFAAFWAVFYGLAFVIALSAIVFVHELGHFQVARWLGVRAEVFSVGFGRELFGFTDRQGTRWKFCLLPLGGYVRFEGDTNAASKPDFDSPAAASPTSFPAQPVWKRALIVFAGPAANFIGAFFIFWASFAFVGNLYMEPIVDEVMPGSAAQKAGFQPGDRILSVDGKITASFEDVVQSVWLHGGEELEIAYERNGTVNTVKVVPDVTERPDNFGGTVKVGLLGIKHQMRADEPKTRYFTAAEAIDRAAWQVWSIIRSTIKFIGKLFVGDQNLNQIGGPGSIAKAAGDAAYGGANTFLMILGLLSVSIGLINLFPVPMLDGGHLVFYAIEALRGKPLGQQAQEWGYRIGLTFVALLMMVGILNDSGRFINHFFGT